MPELNPFTPDDKLQLDSVLENLEAVEGLLAKAELADIDLRGARERFNKQRDQLIKLKQVFFS